MYCFHSVVNQQGRREREQCTDMLGGANHRNIPFVYACVYIYKHKCEKCAEYTWPAGKTTPLHFS